MKKYQRYKKYRKTTIELAEKLIFGELYFEKYIKETKFPKKRRKIKRIVKKYMKNNIEIKPIIDNMETYDFTTYLGNDAYISESLLANIKDIFK